MGEQWVSLEDPRIQQLFDDEAGRLALLADQALTRGDALAGNFYAGLLRVVHLMEDDIELNPRPAPEVIAFLTRPRNYP